MVCFLSSVFCSQSRLWCSRLRGRCLVELIDEFGDAGGVHARDEIGGGSLGIPLMDGLHGLFEWTVRQPRLLCFG